MSYVSKQNLFIYIFLETLKLFFSLKIYNYFFASDPSLKLYHYDLLNFSLQNIINKKIEQSYNPSKVKNFLEFPLQAHKSNLLKSYLFEDEPCLTCTSFDRLP